MCARSYDCVGCILAHIVGRVVYIKAWTCCYGNRLWTTRSKGESSIGCYVVSTGNIVVAHNLNLKQLTTLHIFVTCAWNKAKISSLVIKGEFIITASFVTCCDTKITRFACMVEVVWGRLCLFFLNLNLWLRPRNSLVCVKNIVCSTSISSREGKYSLRLISSKGECYRSTLLPVSSIVLYPYLVCAAPIHRSIRTLCMIKNCGTCCGFRLRSTCKNSCTSRDIVFFLFVLLCNIVIRTASSK